MIGNVRILHSRSKLGAKKVITQYHCPVLYTGYSLRG